MRPVAVVGLSPSTHDQAPFEDPEWECWGLPWDRGYWIHYDRLFEMHDRVLWEDPRARREHGYLDKLQTQVSVPLYMHEAQDDIGNSREYPFRFVNDEVFKGFARWDQDDWYGSSPAYMVALAIAFRAPKIGLWGVDLSKTHETDYRYQLPNMDYLLGVAAGRGIEIFLPEGPTELLKFEGSGMNVGDLKPTYRKRYGHL